MKAIIVDFDQDYLIVANSRGDFKKVYNNYPGCRVGDEITVNESKTAFIRPMLSSAAWKRALSVAACLLLMIITSYGAYSYTNPVTYVTVDINPSVELSLNRYNLVLEASGLNDEGNIIVGDGREYRNMKLDRAFNMLLSKAVEANYLDTNTNAVMLTVSNINDSISPNIEKQLKEIAKANTLRHKKEQDATNQESLNAAEAEKGDIIVIVENTTFEKHQEAKQMDISQGKLVLYDKLKKVKPDAALNHVKEASVAQIIKEIGKIDFEQTHRFSPKDRDNDIHKNQQFKDIKTLRKNVKNQLKDIREDNENQLKEEIIKNKGLPKSIIRDIKKQTDKTLKDELKVKGDNIKEQKENLKGKINQDKNNDKDNNNDKKESSGQNNKKITDIFKNKVKNNKSEWKNKFKNLKTNKKR